MEWGRRDVVKRLNELALRENKQYRVMSAPIMIEAAEEISRLRCEIELLEDHIKVNNESFEAERNRLYDDMAKLNNVLFKIKHYAADFEEVLEIIRTEERLK